MLYSEQVQMQARRSSFILYGMLPWTMEGAVQVQAGTVDGGTETPL